MDTPSKVSIDSASVETPFFEKSEYFQGLAGKVMGTPVNLKFREIANIEKMTVLGDVSDDLMENLAPMNPISKRYKGGLS